MNSKSSPNRTLNTKPAAAVSILPDSWFDEKLQADFEVSRSTLFSPPSPKKRKDELSSHHSWHGSQTDFSDISWAKSPQQPQRNVFKRLEKGEEWNVTPWQEDNISSCTWHDSSSLFSGGSGRWKAKSTGKSLPVLPSRKTSSTGHKHDSCIRRLDVWEEESTPHTSPSKTNSSTSFSNHEEDSPKPSSSRIIIGHHQKRDVVPDRRSPGPAASRGRKNRTPSEPVACGRGDEEACSIARRRSKSRERNKTRKLTPPQKTKRPSCRPTSLGKLTLEKSPGRSPKSESSRNRVKRSTSAYSSPKDKPRLDSNGFPTPERRMRKSSANRLPRKSTGARVPLSSDDRRADDKEVDKSKLTPEDVGANAGLPACSPSRRTHKISTGIDHQRARSRSTSRGRCSRANRNNTKRAVASEQNKGDHARGLESKQKSLSPNKQKADLTSRTVKLDKIDNSEGKERKGFRDEDCSLVSFDTSDQQFIKNHAKYQRRGSLGSSLCLTSPANPQQRPRVSRQSSLDSSTKPIFRSPAKVQRTKSQPLTATIRTPRQEPPASRKHVAFNEKPREPKPRCFDVVDEEEEFRKPGSLNAIGDLKGDVVRGVGATQFGGKGEEELMKNHVYVPPTPRTNDIRLMMERSLQYMPEIIEGSERSRIALASPTHLCCRPSRRSSLDSSKPMHSSPRSVMMSTKPTGNQRCSRRSSMGDTQTSASSS